MKNKSLIKKVGYIVGGSAVAGFGFSFGRDIYKHFKKNVGGVIVIIAIVGLLFGSYTIGIWVARNYRDLFEKIWRRMSAILILVPVNIVLFVPIEESGPYHFLALASIVLFGIGIIVGLFQRRKRKRIWATEDHNNVFMDGHGLIEHDDSTIEDSKDRQNYRIDNVGSSRITLFPLGKRGKRAYIYLDENGFFTEYTGMV